MEITSDGKIAIPQEIQQTLGFLPGITLEFEVVGAELHLKRKLGGQDSHLIATMRGKATTNLSSNEILALTRQDP